jgi:hypothetical protein
MPPNAVQAVPIPIAASRRLPLAVLIGGAFALLIAVSLLAGAITAARWHAADRERELQRFLVLKAEQFALSVAEALDNRQRILQLIASRASIVQATADPATARSLLDAIQRNWPEYAWLGVTDLDGRIVASSGGVLSGQSAAARGWFAAGRRAPFIGGVHEPVMLKGSVRTRAGGEPARLMDIAVPMRDAQGTVIGVFAAHLDDIWLEQLRRHAAQTSTDGQSFRLVLMEADGTPIARDDVPHAEVPQLRAEVALPGSPTLRTLDWRVVASLPLAEVEREVSRFQQRALAAGGAGALICLPLLWFLSRRLARPIEALSRSVRHARAQAGASGDGAVAVPVGGTTETALLGTEVRDLLDEVHHQRAELVSREAQLRQLLQAAPDAIVSVDAQRRIVLANAAAETMFGRPLAQLMGRSLNDLIPSRLHAVHDRHVEGFAVSNRPAGAMSRKTDLVAVRADGSEFPIEASIFRSGTGADQRMTAIVRDITERRRAETALHASMLRYRHLFYDHPVPMWVYDSATLRFLEVNEVAVARYGWSREEFLGMTILDIRPPADAATVRASAQAIDRDARDFWSSGPWLHVTRSGERRRVLIAGHAVEWDGQAARLVAVQDVTDLLAAQAEMRQQREELSALSRELITKEASERAALAQILHDRFAQNLVAARLTIEGVNQQLRAMDVSALGKGSPISGSIGAVLQLLTEAIGDVRGLLNDLRPPLLDDFGLRAALQFEVDRRRPGAAVALRFEVEGSDPDGPGEQQRVDRATEYAIFMIVREALHNALMHARAAQVVVRYAFVDAEGGEVQVEVIDDGVGFDLVGGAERIGHLGLVGMQQRARTIGAQLAFHTAPGQGSRIALRWSEAIAAAARDAGSDAAAEDEAAREVSA